MILPDEEGMSVAISQEAAEFVVSDARIWHPKETGGVLVGCAKEGRFRIEHAVGPGPKAVHERAFFQRDQAYSECQVEFIHNASDGEYDYIGEWHSHSRRQGPSATDIHSMASIRNDASNNCRHPLLVIVMQHRGLWTFSAFVPDDIGLNKIPIKVM